MENSNVKSLIGGDVKILNDMVGSCQFGNKCRDGPAKCIYQHRVRHLKLRELQAQGVFTIEYCRTNKMMADLFTKNLPAPQFKALADYITGRCGDVTSEPMVNDEGRAMPIYEARH